MKLLLTTLILLMAASPTFAEQVDLETDDGFFGAGKNPHQEDDLDRAYRKSERTQAAEQLKTNDLVVKDELISTTPQVMSKAEAAEIDRRLVAENKRRKKAILKAVSANAGVVKSCIDQNKKSFQGSQITLQWLIDPAGKVVRAEIKDSDFNNPEVASCVRKSAQNIDFSGASIQQYKKSLVQYTYKVNVKSSRMPASVPKSRVRPR